MNSPHNVTRNGCNRSFVTMSPFDRPIAAPISSTSGTASSGGIPARTRNIGSKQPVMPITDPTDKSMPPEMITIA